MYTVETSDSPCLIPLSIQFPFGLAGAELITTSQRLGTQGNRYYNFVVYVLKPEQTLVLRQTCMSSVAGTCLEQLCAVYKWSNSLHSAV